MSTYVKVNDNLHYVRMGTGELQLLYWDQAKSSAPYSSYANAGFFGNYAGGYTLPVANLLCSIDTSSVPAAALTDLNNWGCVISNGKLYKRCNQPVGNPFYGKSVSTFFVDSYLNCYIQKLNNVYTDMTLAVSGPPIMINGVQTTLADATSEGWDTTWTYSTWHGALCTTSNTWELIYVAMNTDFSNAYSTLTGLGLGITNAIFLDGGTSFYFKKNATTVSTGGTTRVNSIILI